MITFSKPVRTLTISTLFKRSQFSKSRKPKLTLSGDWLKEAGFGIGEKVTLKISDNKIIIEKAL